MPAPRFSLLAALTLVALPLGACQQRAAPTPLVSAAPPAPSALPLPAGAGCGPEIARTQAIVTSDVETGNLNRPVGERFSADLAQAAAACSAGRSGEALGLLNAARSRYGYR